MVIFFIFEDFFSKRGESDKYLFIFLFIFILFYFDFVSSGGEIFFPKN